ncbi:MAG: hypothetical protein ABI162_04540 [Luteolibacter sp.]
MKSKPKNLKPKGFALIVTLSLMILLTVVAVGLLSLSSISLRSTSQGDAMSRARANAKLALMLAIGDLQKAAGPDKRITAPANLVNTTAPAGITGVWNSARPSFTNPDYTSTKTGDNFLGYLMSNPSPQSAPDPQTLPNSTGKLRPLVGPKSVGASNPNAEISAPELSVTATKGNTPGGAVSWVTMDEGVKGRIDLLPSNDSTSQGELITQVGSPARNGFQTVENMDFLKEDKSKLRESLPKLVSLNQANLKADSKTATAQYFHDFTVSSNSLQVDVANGGLKTDLSVVFDGAYGAGVPSPYSGNYLYSGTNAPFQGATSDVQWSLYANYARLYRNTTAAGIKAVLPSGYKLKQISDATLKKPRYEPDMATVKQPVLMPTVVRVDTIFSLVTHDSHHYVAKYPYMLHLMYLPVITLHNPYNVPLRVSNLQVGFADIPVGFEFLVNGLPVTTAGLTSLNQLYWDTNKAREAKTFNMQLSNSLGGASDVVMGAGETRIFGTPFSPDTTWAAELGTNGYAKGVMFDWQSNQTGAAFTKPGMITSSNIGIGFDVDWLAPNGIRSQWLTDRKPDGVVVLKADDTIKVRYGPKAPSTASNSFAVTVRMGTGNTEAARTQVFYLSDARLKAIMEEGVSERFPDKRSFPETCPRASESPITTMSLYEPNGNPIKKYERSRPFAVFSVSAKTTMESFTKSRPVTDTGIAFQMATCDFTNAASEGASPLEFALVPVKNGGSAIESGGITDSTGKTPLQAFFFGGHGTRRGSNNATFYEIPMAPLQSLAQLRHANGGSIGSAPYVTYTVGESRAHPAVPSDAAFLKVDTSRVALDRSWLANDQLWDRYWFSTLSTLQGAAYSGSAASSQAQLAQDFFTGAKRLPNQRNIAYLPSGKMTTDAATAATAAGGTQSAAYIMTQGGFNVNSTSVPAWVSVLSSLATSDVPLASGGNEKDPTGTPFLRLRQPVKGLGGAIVANEKSWNTYRTLDNTEINQLAQQIVAEVKTRGPFLSMSEFVNRRLGSPSDLTTKGAIQAALDRTSINSIMEKSGGARSVSPAEVGGYGWKNNDAVINNTGAGAPGEISQGDVLSSIGSFVSVRSDTFRIRAFGDARNATGGVIARAWCEATIQRVPEYVDPVDSPDVAASATANLNFGRQFKIVAFRWLQPDEI